MQTESITTTTPSCPVNAAAPAVNHPAAGGRLDLYHGIHKALRLMMSRTLCEIGSADPDAADELQGALGLLGRLLDTCELHLKDENDFVHPALERAQPGSAARIAGEHVHHVEAIADLRDLAGLVADCNSAARGPALDRLYRSLALFVADNFQHMDHEQTAHNAVLWSQYSDQQLRDIEHALVASIPPAAMAEMLHWFLPALNAPERVALLAGARQGMPAEAFLGVMEIAERTLSASANSQLRIALGLPPLARSTPV